VSYRVVNNRRSDLSGSKRFMGGHWICIAQGHLDVGKRFVKVADSTHTVLKEWPWWLVQEAAGKFGDDPWGVGRGVYGLVEVAMSHQARISQLENQIETLRDRVEDRDRTIAARDRTIEQKNTAIAQRNTTITNLREQLADAGDCTDEAASSAKAARSQAKADAITAIQALP
jgi:hypothetical protein